MTVFQIGFRSRSHWLREPDLCTHKYLFSPARWLARRMIFRINLYKTTIKIVHNCLSAAQINNVTCAVRYYVAYLRPPPSPQDNIDLTLKPRVRL